MKLGDLIDHLAALDAAREDVEPPMTEAEFRDLDVTVRGMDEDGNDFCGALVDVGIEMSHDGDTEFLSLDASNAPDAETNRETYVGHRSRQAKAKTP